MHLDIKVNDLRMIGIHGLGGIGKTTITKIVYNIFFSILKEVAFWRMLGKSLEKMMA